MAQLHTVTRECAPARTLAHTRKRARAHIHVHTRTRARTHTHTHTHTLTHSLTHSLTHPPPPPILPLSTCKKVFSAPRVKQPYSVFGGAGLTTRKCLVAGTTAGGQTLTVSGSGFLSGGTDVTLCGLTCQPVSGSTTASQILCVTPPNSGKTL